MEVYLANALGEEPPAPVATDLAKRMSSEGVELSDLPDIDEEHLQQTFGLKLGPRIRLLRYVEAHPPVAIKNALAPPQPHPMIRRRSSLLIRDRKLTSAQFMHVWNYYAANQDRIEGANVDALLNDLLRARCTTPLSASELEEDKKLLLEEFASADGSFELSALSVLMSVEECFLFKFKKRSKISSVELMDIWMHYDENGDGSIEKFELEGLLRDLLTAANMPHQEKESGDGGGDGDGGGGNAGDGDGADVFDGSSMPPTVVTPTDVREYAEVLLDMFDTNHDGKISIGELSKILNTEKSYLEHLKGRSSLNKEQFNRVWKHYTKSSAGAPVIAGSSLRALAWDEIRAEQSKAVEEVSLDDILEREAAIVEVSGVAGGAGLTKLNLATLLGLDPAEVV